MHDFDQKYTRLIRGLSASAEGLMSSLTFIGEPWVVLLIGLTGFIAAHQRHQTAIQRAFVYGIIAYGLNICLKMVLHRRRPHGRVVKTFGLRSYSFPSGHAFGSMIFYGLLAYLDLKYLGGPWNVAAALLIGSAIFLIGVSRIYKGSHYPSDVLAGWLLGLISLGVVISLAF